MSVDKDPRPRPKRIHPALDVPHAAPCEGALLVSDLITLYDGMRQGLPYDVDMVLGEAVVRPLCPQCARIIQGLCTGLAFVIEQRLAPLPN